MNQTLLYQFQYLQPNKESKLESAMLDVIHIKMPSLNIQRPLIALSDMQGLVPEGDGFMPLGIEVFEILLPLLSLDSVLPKLSNCICLIAGDMFASTSDFRRGLSGNIDDVADTVSKVGFFKTLMVLGNHDEISNRVNGDGVSKSIDILDGTVHQVDDTTFGGISGVMGNPRKNNRNDEKMFAKKLNAIERQNSNVTLLHEGPHVSNSQIGSEFIFGQLSGVQNKLIISGHAHWQEPIAIIWKSNIVVNTDGRIVLIT